MREKKLQWFFPGILLFTKIEHRLKLREKKQHRENKTQTGLSHLPMSVTTSLDAFKNSMVLILPCSSIAWNPLSCLNINIFLFVNCELIIDVRCLIRDTHETPSVIFVKHQLPAECWRTQWIIETDWIVAVLYSPVDEQACVRACVRFCLRMLLNVWKNRKIEWILFSAFIDLG